MQDSDKADILTEIAAQVLSAGASKFQVEYEDGQEQVSVLHGSVGFGIASLQSASDQAQELRAQLYKAKKRPRKLTIDGGDYLLHVEIFASFGEDAFRGRITRFKE